jgi:preprotein translocase subunit Sec63
MFLNANKHEIFKFFQDAPKTISGIKNLYKDLVLRFHPDKLFNEAQSEASALYNEITQTRELAYQEIKNCQNFVDLNQTIKSLE